MADLFLQVPLTVRYVNNNGQCGGSTANNITDYSETNASQLSSPRRKENLYVTSGIGGMRRYSEAYLPTRRDSMSSNYDYPELVKIPPPRPELPRKLSEGMSILCSDCQVLQVV